MTKTILWDLESSNLNADFGYLLCFGWKELGSKSAHVVSITDFPRFKKDPTDDKDVVMAAAKILSEADIWVGHYAIYFDIPMLNSRLLYHGLKPLPPVPLVDTWQIARNRLKLHSNRLASVCAFLNLEEKTPLSGPIWIRAAAGHKQSIDYVVRHCKQDVVVLEQAYNKIKCLAHNHPNVGLIGNRENTCPICGVFGKLQSRGWHIAKTNKRQRYQCQACGGWFRGKPVKGSKILVS